MRRRQFLKSLSAAAAAPAFVQSAAAAPWKLNYMVASSMYGNLPLAEILPEVKKTGADAIELWPRKHGTQREEMDALGHDKVSKMLKDAGLRFGGTTRYDLGPFALDEECAVVKKMGGNVIVSGGSGEYKVTGEQLKANVQAFVEKMKPHAAVAAEHGVTIGIENHVNNLIDTPDSLRWLADMTREIEGIGIALAPAHLPQEPALLASLITQIDKKLTLFYAWGRGQGFFKEMPRDDELQQLPGHNGALEWKPIIRALKDIQFAGPTEIFMHHTPRGVPILPTAAEVTAAMAKSRGTLDKIVAELNA